jgi:prepilin-type N-terminal cleavage/methylation domain-containing protein/prepilin-type processing-associated H-X9-DG protein
MSNGNARNGQRQRGFTLVELLVVIGIIAVLISILLPTLGRARETARTVACASNARQLALAIRLFAQDHRGYMPALSDKDWVYQNDPTRSIWVYRAVGGQEPVPLDWASSLLPYLGVRGVEWFPDAPGRGSKVFLCPSDSAQFIAGSYGTAGPAGPGLVIFNNIVPFNAGWPISYGVNADIGAQIDRRTNQGRFGLSDNMNVYGDRSGAGGVGLPLNGKLDKVRRASEVLLVADCGVRYPPGQPAPSTTTPLDRYDAVYYTTNYMSSSSGVPPQDMGKLSGVAKTGWLQKRIPWDRHRKKINVTFCDGHGETIQQNTDEYKVRISPYNY